MNFLGHFYTARGDDLLMVGSFLGDFLKGRVESHPSELIAGLRLHRRVDRIVDTAPPFRSIARSLRPASGRYATVSADIVCDHLLASGWDRYEARSLEEFVAECHRVLEEQIRRIPPLPARVARRLIDESWLLSYASVDGLVASVRRLESRIGVGVGAEEIGSIVEKNRAELTALFGELMGALTESVDTFRRAAGS